MNTPPGGGFYGRSHSRYLQGGRRDQSDPEHDGNGQTGLVNELSGASDLKVMLAYGKDDTPLVPTSTSQGYVSAATNTGGPLRLIVGQTAAGDLNAAKSVKCVTEIEVQATAGDSWKHDHGIYTEYQDQAVLRITGSDIKEPRTFSLKQLEALDEYIVRHDYSGESTVPVEGVILWNLIKDVVGLKDGITQPVLCGSFLPPAIIRLPISAR
jgi:DMSO/TMAO reductase YedYZ molybdopterin-dependent catalytic subunit